MPWPMTPSPTTPIFTPEVSVISKRFLDALSYAGSAANSTSPRTRGEVEQAAPRSHNSRSSGLRRILERENAQDLLARLHAALRIGVAAEVDLQRDARRPV